MILIVILMMSVGASADHVSRASSQDALYELSNRVQLVEAIAKGNNTCGELYPAHYGGPGYNCKGYVWVGLQMVRALWDTGATRNTIDRDFLLGLLDGRDSSLQVVEVKTIPKVWMKSFNPSEPRTPITSKARLEIKFKESETKWVIKEIELMVLKKCTSLIAFGKPTMDYLGFQSNRSTIHLQREDIRFPTTVTDQNDSEELYACSYEHEIFDGHSGKAEIKNVKVKVLKECKGGAWWIEKDENLPDDIQVVEGPLIRTKENRHAAMVRVLAEGKHRSGPGDRLAKIRPMTSHDEKILNGCIDLSTKAHQAKHKSESILEESRSLNSTKGKPLAAAKCLGENLPQDDGEEEGPEFMEAKHIKKDKKEKHAALFPELEKEGEAMRAGLSGGIKYEDQEGEEFRKVIEEKSEKLINPDISKKNKSSFLSRILRKYSMCFWITGCTAPQVEGFVASIKLKPDAVGRCMQPFKLSQYDQYRVAVHEDVMIAEGKAVWAEPGTSLAFASPTFVVDQSGKGCLGRPVHDYRYLNSQTFDCAWNSAESDKCLERVQAGWFNTSLDCVWGFIQLPVDEETSKLLALVTRRGIMLPRVLYPGPKQGPGIFQSFVDTAFRGIRGDDGEEFLSIFVDDCNISTPKCEDEREDECFEKHLRHLELFLETAKKRKVQFKPEKPKH